MLFLNFSASCFAHYRNLIYLTVADGFKSFESTPSRLTGISTFMISSISVDDSWIEPSWIAFMTLLVTGISNLLPTPYGPVHPELTMNTLLPNFDSFH